MILYSDYVLYNRSYIYAMKDDTLIYFGPKEDALISIAKDYKGEEIYHSVKASQLFEDEMDAYLKGTLKDFSIAVAINGTDFQKRVYHALLNVEYGQSISYAALSQRIDHEKAVRAVGSAVGKNRIMIVIPCHRIIAKDGSLGGFTGGLDLKVVLLEKEQSL